MTWTRHQLIEPVDDYDDDDEQDDRIAARIWKRKHRVSRGNGLSPTS